VKWPARLPKNAVCDEPVISLDIFPTICAAVGVPLPKDRVYDGRNMLPVILGQAKGPLHEALFWDGNEKKHAARSGKWKLVDWKLVDNNGKVELFDLEADLGEENDLSAKHPDVLKRLQQAYATWRAQMAPQIRRRPPRPARAKQQ